jgi:hypothetical protein
MARPTRTLAQPLGAEMLVANGQGAVGGPVSEAEMTPAPPRRCAQVSAEFWFLLGLEGAAVEPPPRFAYAYRLGLRTAALKR